jgi:hypothetical protein
MTSSSLQRYEHFGTAITKTQRYLLVGAPGYRINGTVVGRIYGYQIFSGKPLLQFTLDGTPAFQVGHCIKFIRWSGQENLLFSAPHTVIHLE